MTISFDPPKIYEKACASNLKLTPEQFKEFNLWKENQDAPMIFTGAPGRGKTYAAAAFYNYRELKKMKLAEEDKRILWNPEQASLFCNLAVLFHEFLMCFDCKGARERLTNRLLEPKLLILDDMGIREPSPGFADFLYLIIDQRINREKDLTLITTNCTSKQLADLYGERIASRIATGYCIKFEGEDLRRQKRSF